MDVKLSTQEPDVSCAGHSHPSFMNGKTSRNVTWRIWLPCSNGIGLLYLLQQKRPAADIISQGILACRFQEKKLLWLLPCGTLCPLSWILSPPVWSLEKTSKLAQLIGLGPPIRAFHTEVASELKRKPHFHSIVYWFNFNFQCFILSFLSSCKLPSVTW